jgi:hypothetical protein
MPVVWCFFPNDQAERVACHDTDQHSCRTEPPKQSDIEKSAQDHRRTSDAANQGTWDVVRVEKMPENQAGCPSPRQAEQPDESSQKAACLRRIDPAYI